MNICAQDWFVARQFGDRNRAVRYRGMSDTSGASDGFGQLSARFGLNGGGCVVCIAGGR